MTTKSLLVVDDNPENLKLILMILASGAYELVTASDAMQALHAIEQRIPDLILLDLQLPGVDGLELTRRLKANPQTRTIPVVAVTAYAMKGDEEKARSAGCDGYLVKPVDKRTLREVVKNMLCPTGPSA
jgi:CheY-like chemotaxis protein